MIEQTIEKGLTFERRRPTNDGNKRVTYREQARRSKIEMRVAIELLAVPCKVDALEKRESIERRMIVQRERSKGSRRNRPVAMAISCSGTTVRAEQLPSHTGRGNMRPRERHSRSGNEQICDVASRARGGLRRRGCRHRDCRRSS